MWHQHHRSKHTPWLFKNCFEWVAGVLLSFSALVGDVCWPLLTTGPGRRTGNSHNYCGRTRQEGLGPKSTQKGTGENRVFLKGRRCRGRRQLASACNAFAVRSFLFCWLHFFPFRQRCLATLCEDKVNVLASPSSWGQVIFMPWNWTFCDTIVAAYQYLGNI